MFSLSTVPPGAPGGGEEALRASLEALTRCQNPLNLRKTPSSNLHPTFLVRTLFSAFGSLLTPPHSQRGSPRLQPLSPYAITRTRVCSHSHPHTDTQKRAHTTPHLYSLAFRVRHPKCMNIHYLQALVTAKLFATSKLSMWGVSLNSEVEN